MATNYTSANIGFYVQSTNIEELDNSELVEQIKNLIVKKKLASFTLVDYTYSLPPCPILKPTLNSEEKYLIIKAISPGKLYVGKITLGYKIMAYMDDNNTMWEIATNSENKIIDVCICHHQFLANQTIPIEYKIFKSIEKITSSIDTTIVSCPNVYNNMESFEYKIILSAILRGYLTTGKTYLEFVEKQIVIDTIGIIQQIGPWKIINVESLKESKYVFMCGNNEEQVWIIVTDCEINNVTEVFMVTDFL